MAPVIHGLRKKLSYPLYAADFDPLNQDFLLVGGGGGSTSSGVPNKISLIDTSRRTELAEIAEIELAKDEDAVTTLAVASSSDTALTAIAGINSSTKDQEAGKNEHLRTFRIALPGRKRKADSGLVETSEKAQKLASAQALGKTALFTSAHGPKNDTYQRVLRASPIQSTNEARISAVASGLAPENEVITFQPVANALTSAIDVISRVNLGKAEAADVDVMGVPGTGHTLAYCTDDAVFIQRLPYTKGSQIEAPSKLYQPPELTDATPPSERPRFRALRLLTPKHILVLQNRPGRAGAGLLMLAINKDDSQGYVTLWKFLKSTTKSAVGLDTCRLSESEDGARQYVVAVAGQDSSIELLTLDYVPFKGFAKFRPYAHMRDIHTGPLTKLIFSNFIGPSDPISKDTPVQSVRLASVGVDQTVVVHTLPLRLHRTSKTKKPSYVLIPPSSAQLMQTTFSVLIAIFVAVIAAFLTQVFCEIRGAVPPTLGAPDWLSPELREKIARPYIFSNESTLSSASAEMSAVLSSAISAIEEAPSHITIPSIETIPNSLSDIMAENSLLETPKAIVVRDSGSDLSAELHHDADLIKEETLKKWEDLTAHQKRGWKQKLKDEGHWAEQQGENVLKGLLFGELAGIVGG